MIKKEIKKEETSPGKENRLNQEKEENLMREKEKEASKKETSKKRPSKGAAAGNLSKKRKRIQVSSKTIWLKKLKSTIEWYSGIVNISSYFAQECL